MDQTSMAKLHPMKQSHVTKCTILGLNKWVEVWNRQTLDLQQIHASAHILHTKDGWSRIDRLIKSIDS